MEELIRTAGICFLIGFLALVIKERSPQVAILLTLCGSVLLLTELLHALKMAVTMLHQFAGYVPGLGEYSSILLKVLLIAFLSEICIHLLKSMDQPLLAIIIEWTGKMIILMIAFPVFIELMENMLMLLPDQFAKEPF
ncbi:SpoIIIAC/SpoIIIAD family protein [Jeotgalibacillus aurantiacus]|uniref:SpoIIIAC/SpoIIIAD family protein n=1 Tax=Jeotgalibacillus aurantiacus TaxID=2763266 RepID=UPI001D09CE55|nr:SpoIIIAC/SpoIIIAD family protein [Jeotgalibacillus aurantiacus]